MILSHSLSSNLSKLLVVTTNQFFLFESNNPWMIENFNLFLALVYVLVSNVIFRYTDLPIIKQIFALITGLIIKFLIFGISNFLNFVYFLTISRNVPLSYHCLCRIYRHTYLQTIRSTSCPYIHPILCTWLL